MPPGVHLLHCQFDIRSTSTRALSSCPDGDYHRDPDKLLFQAKEQNDFEAVQQALKDGANVDAVSLPRWCITNTPLFLPCFRGHNEIVRNFLDAGADVHWTGGDGRTAAHIAS